MCIQTESFNIGADNLPDINDANGWILANVDQVGYYRVTYPVSNWLALSNQLNTNHEVCYFCKNKNSL